MLSLKTIVIQLLFMVITEFLLSFGENVHVNWEGRSSPSRLLCDKIMCYVDNVFDAKSTCCMLAGQNSRCAIFISTVILIADTTQQGVQIVSHNLIHGKNEDNNVGDKS